MLFVAPSYLSLHLTWVWYPAHCSSPVSLSSKGPDCFNSVLSVRHQGPAYLLPSSSDPVQVKKFHGEHPTPSFMTVHGPLSSRGESQLALMNTETSQVFTVFLLCFQLMAKPEIQLTAWQFLRVSSSSFWKVKESPPPKVWTLFCCHDCSKTPGSASQVICGIICRPNST